MEDESRREKAKNSLEKYTHYFERWQSNQSSRQKALEDLHQMQTVNMDKVKELQGIGVGDGEFEFLLNAWKQIVECRRVLRWTYAYGYYIPDHDTAKKQFFEHLQGQAESGLEKLHHCAETELLPFLNEDCPKQNSLSHAFIHFKTKLAALTEVTKIYFENLVRALENDLSDVKFQ
jgi:ariadne-1